jgi:hypothetical protein
MVVGRSVKVEVGMGGFTVHCMTQGAIRFSVNIYVKEGKVAVSYLLTLVLHSRIVLP